MSDVYELHVMRQEGLVDAHLRSNRTGNECTAIGLRDPAGVVLEPDGDPFTRSLAWYLETFLRYPTDLDVDRARRVTDALAHWGRHNFDLIFGTQSGAVLYAEATRGGGPLDFVVKSNDPSLLAWPWEALTSTSGYLIGTDWRVARRLTSGEVQRTLDELQIESERLEVLLVTARPGGRSDVRYRSISRPLVDLVRDRQRPIRVELLRPPTFAQLEAHLEANPGRYHVLHFDGHGTYTHDKPGGGSSSAPRQDQSPYTFAVDVKRGFLQFEVEPGEDPEKGLIDAERISALLNRHRLPMVVLNACRSAMVDGFAADEFASLAGALVKAGVRSVVAMSHVLWVTGAQEFVPAFYRGLLESANVPEAARRGRLRMKEQPARECSRGRWDLDDWIVPVVFEQHPASVKLIEPTGSDAGEEAQVTQKRMPREALIADAPFGFIGRDGPIMDLEQAMLRRSAVVIQGIGGIGKSTLAQGFLEWLADTGGLHLPPLWFALDAVSGIEYVLNRIGDAFGLNAFGTLPTTRRDGEQAPSKLDVLRQAFQQLPTPVVCVLDNFEVVTDQGEGQPTGRYPVEDREAVLQLVRAAHGTPFRIIITSRSREDWLGAEYRSVVELPGLDGEERWEYVTAVVKTLGLPLDRNDADLAALLDALGGHPLLMRVVLPRLTGAVSAKRAFEEIGSGLPETLAQGAGDETLEKLGATLRFATEGLPEELRPLLTLVALHERYVDSHMLGLMARQIDARWDDATIGQFVNTMTHAGLVRPMHGVLEHGVLLDLHPALAGHLRSTWLPRLDEAERARWTRAFVEIMARQADAIVAKPGHEQQPYHTVHGANFRSALELAQADEDERQSLAALTQSLAAHAENTLNFDEAERLYQKLAEVEGARGERGGVAGAYHQLGMVAQERRDFDLAEGWYTKALEISERLGDRHGAAGTYHQLGVVAQERRDFDAAEGWYRKSLEIEERLGDEHGAANTYHQLGRVAEERRDFDAAEGWYKKSLEIEERLGNEHGAAITYHQLGRMAEERRDFEAAEGWYTKSLEIKERLGDEHGAANTYHQLGRVAEERRDFDAAEGWYKKSLEIDERLGDQHKAAITYAQLGLLARARGDLPASVSYSILAASRFAKKNDQQASLRAILQAATFILLAPESEREGLITIVTQAGIARAMLDRVLEAARQSQEQDEREPPTTEEDPT